MIGGVPFSLPELGLAVVGGLCALVANLTCLEMVDKVNERVPESERVSWFGWSSDIVRQYAQYYPGGRLALRLRIVEIGMAICFLGIMLLILRS